MATLYIGGRLFDGEKVHDAQAVLEEGGKIKRAARKENHRLMAKRGVVARDNRGAFVRQPTRVAAE